MPAAPVLAHLGGVPETLTIALPVLIFTGFLLLEKRARRRERERADPARPESRDDAVVEDGEAP